MSRLSVLAVLLAATGCNNDSSINRIFVDPHVAITSPEPGAVLRRSEGLQRFEGVVSDDFDEPPALTVSWSVDEGPQIEAAADDDGLVTLDLDVDALSLGTHRIELLAVDTDGGHARAGLLWELAGALSAPVVTITAPDDGQLFLPGEEIAFRGEATDATTAGDDLVFAWRSDKQGELTGAISGGGQSVVFSDYLQEGTHKITLEATDTDGDTGAASIEVRVGEVIEPAEPGDLVFSEMMINPQVVADEVGEWVELYNTASYAIDVGGYTFHDLDFDLYVLEGPLIVAGKDYIVLCADTRKSVNGGVPCDGPFKRETADALALGNGSDEVILSRPDGVVIDEVYYDRTWFDPGVAVGLDPSYLESADNDRLDHWCDQTTVISTGGEPGTPGQRNDPC